MDMQELHQKRVQFWHVRVKCMQFWHVRVFSDSRNMQKSVTQIVYLGPLPIHQVRRRSKSLVNFAMALNQPLIAKKFHHL